MRSVVRFSVLILFIGCIASTAGLAAGAVDGEVGAAYWANDFETSSGTSSASSDAGAPGFRAQLWMYERYGFRAEHFTSDADFTSETSDYTSLDVMWKALAPAKNNFLAVGLGWQSMDLGDVGMSGGTSGVRMSLEGRIKVVGGLQAYGQGAYLPSLDDASSVNSLMRFEDMKGHEIELGFAYNVTPLISLRAGYRQNQVDYTETAVASPGTSGLGAPPMLVGGGGGPATILVPSAPQPSTVLGSGGATASGAVDSKGFVAGLSLRF